MNRIEYLRRAFKAYNEGRIDGGAYDAAVMNADIFCDDDECDGYGLPDTYAEVEYSDFDSAEAIDGARWDDMNFRYYMER